ncbi:thiol:disulfide interchange protein DsbA/DsbL [Marilutibacter alkalisoli]|uniref:Thiol:disulfide interchange protein n=1 Tax=Marilutibacter alkalisoli TaxID=2591633 RepID=A0A514BND9_9GAMM|nr:thiol:disulfide interchange protein DsbA/DsbL [Lysobacter alkalisoli]QDH68906.1 thiol:disulfide interchange protein DsbA/DsbL [Lysobacter alkalisoli]
MTSPLRTSPRARLFALSGLLAALTAVTILLLPGQASVQTTAPVAGKDYIEIPDGKRLGPDDGKIEVVEVFAYACHHCASFAPTLEAWKQKQGRDVRVTYLPLPYGAQDPLAAAYFAAEKMDVLSRTHDATFRAIHDERLLPRNPSADEIATFYADKGVDAARLKALMTSQDILDRLSPARDFAIRSGVEGTPTLIVNGRYRIAGRTFDDQLRTADHLIARERAATR